MILTRHMYDLHCFIDQSFHISQNPLLCPFDVFFSAGNLRAVDYAAANFLSVSHLHFGLGDSGNRALLFLRILVLVLYFILEVKFNAELFPETGQDIKRCERHFDVYFVPINTGTLCTYNSTNKLTRDFKLNRLINILCVCMNSNKMAKVDSRSCYLSRHFWLPQQCAEFPSMHGRHRC